MTQLSYDLPCLLNQTNIWQINLIEHLTQISSYQSLLNLEETTRAQRYYHERDRHYFTITRACLRLILGQALHSPATDICFDYNTHGKPYIKKENLSFNVTHAQDLALIAIGKNLPLGIDIEYTLRKVNYLALAKRYFAKEEVQQLTSTSSNQQREIFFNLWTRKEAVIKAMGLGLSFPLQAFAVDGVEPKVLRIDQGDFKQADWHLISFNPAPHYTAALASIGNPGKSNKIYEFTPEIAKNMG